MTPSEFSSARHALGLSVEGMARFLHLGSERTVRRWEDGSQDIPGPVIVLIGGLLKVPERVRRIFGLSV